MSKRILVVEDTEDNRAILRDLLTHAGFNMLEAADGAAGVVMARADKPDLILMDIELPGVDGCEATARIEADPELRHIPVIAVSSHGQPSDAAKAISSGCVAYVAKPCSPRAVLATIREFLP
jgi:two-component system cell cycle response regulator DivK